MKTVASLHPKVVTAATNAPSALRDIKPPVEISSGWAWLTWTLLGLALAALAIWLYRRRRRKQLEPAPAPPPVPAHRRAREQLRAAERYLSDPRVFCILISNALRQYLAERFDFHAPDRTTEEFLGELQNTWLLSPEQKGLLADFLQQCDLVKFARFEPPQTALTQLLDSAHRLIDETEPHAPGPGPAAPQPLSLSPAE